MVGRLENMTTKTQVAGSVGSPVVDKVVQEIAPAQGVPVQAERNLGNTERMIPVEQAENMVERMNNFLASENSQLKFVFHNELNEYYVTIIDSKTDEVIREIPSKKLMDIHAAAREFARFIDRQESLRKA